MDSSSDQTTSSTDEEPPAGSKVPPRSFQALRDVGYGLSALLRAFLIPSRWLLVGASILLSIVLTLYDTPLEIYLFVFALSVPVIIELFGFVKAIDIYLETRRMDGDTAIVRQSLLADVRNDTEALDWLLDTLFTISMKYASDGRGRPGSQSAQQPGPQPLVRQILRKINTVYARGLVAVALVCVPIVVVARNQLTLQALIVTFVVEAVTLSVFSFLVVESLLDEADRRSALRHEKKHPKKPETREEP